MLVSLVLLEGFSIGLFALFLTHMEDRDMRDRDRQRLEHQVTSLCVQTEEAYEDNRPDVLAVAVRMVGAAPSVLRAKITDPAGNMLSVSAGEPAQVHLIPSERSILDRFTGHAPRIFSLGDNRWEAVKPIYFAYQLRGYAWVESDPVWEEEQVFDTVRATLIFGTIWIAASFVLVWLMSLLITRPMAILHHGTRALAAHPESSAAFPLPVTVENDFGDLISAFNSMVASIEEQRAGLRDTLPSSTPSSPTPPSDSPSSTAPPASSASTRSLPPSPASPSAPTSAALPTNSSNPMSPPSSRKPSSAFSPPRNPPRTWNSVANTR